MAAQPAHTQNTFNNKGNVANQAARRGLYGPYTINYYHWLLKQHNPSKKLSHEDYTVGWICPLEVEQTAALEMLDKGNDRLPQSPADHNVYNLGSIANHNVVIAGLHQPGNNSAATVVTQMRMTFPNLRFGLLVGIRGGVPVKTDNGMIRLGDVVVSKPAGGHSGAIQYDHGKAETGHFKRTGALALPPAVLLNAAQDLAAQRARSRTDPVAKNIKRIDTNIRGLRKYKNPGSTQDHLYKPDYIHLNPGISCIECGCDSSQRIQRAADAEDDEPYVVVHRGTIASGELVVKNGNLRDQLAKEYGVLCFEIEAAGALTDFPCIVIRGISDYCDSHKNDQWHGYAAAAAAAYARQLFFHMPIDEVKRYVSSAIEANPNPQDYRALHEAAARGLVDIVQTLLAEGCPLGLRSPDGENAMHQAAQRGHSAVVDLLWRNGGEKLSRQPGGYWHDRPIHSAAFSGHLGVVETLVKLGASIHECQRTNQTALHIACQHGRPNVARKLLELGADPTLCDRDDMTPLHFVAQNGHVEIIPDLLKAQNGSLPAFLAMRCKPNGDTALHRAAICAFDGRVEYWPYVPIPAAIRDKTYLDCFKLLYKAGADISAVNNTAETPLHLASTAGNLLIVNFILYRLSESERLKALALATLTEGHTPLHKAIIQGHSDVVRRLIEAGADPNHATADGDSTLQLAEDTGRHDIVQFLLSLPS